MDQLLEALWTFLSGALVAFAERYWSAGVTCTALAYYATRGAKVAIRDYVEARGGKGYRPPWYRTVLFFTPGIVGTISGALLGQLEITPYAAGEGALAGAVAGLSASVTVTILRRRAAKHGLISEHTSQDLTLEPMPAVRSDVPTDPVVVDAPKDDP